MKLLVPKTDIVFHSLFKTGNEDITISLISSILKEPISKIDLSHDKHLYPNSPQEKLGILDLRATINESILCNIEIQLINHYNIEKRLLYYWSRLYSSQLKQGEDYRLLCKTVSIAILDFELPKLKEMEDLHSSWAVIERKEGKLILTEDFDLHIIELPKAMRMLKKHPHNRIAKWAMFFSNPNKEEVLAMLKEDPELNIAVHKLEELSQDKDLQRLAELREKAIKDEVSLKNGATLEGIEKGMKKGLKQGSYQAKLEIAQKLLAMDFPVEVIASITELEKKEIEALCHKK